jgi:hypothetical protein
MAAYFQLINLETGEATSFNKIDEEICAAFGWVVDDNKYAWDWYNTIGQRVAMGMTLDEVRTKFIGYIVNNHGCNEVKYYTYLIGILNWISNNYTTNAWYSRGK